MTGSDKIITMAHGSGGRLSHQLLENTVVPIFENNILATLDDSAVLGPITGNLAFTTDSYVIDPIFFPGGDIGKLAICGTVNDLSVQGAKPLFLSTGFILEEGFPLAQLQQIIESMARTARLAKVQIVTGDTKVVPAGKADKVFINTAGIGVVRTGEDLSSKNARVGDAVILSGTIGDHGMAVLCAREDFQIKANLESDVMPLSDMIHQVLKVCPRSVHVMRDPTRGGIASALNEIAQKSKVGVELIENDIPIRPEVEGICHLLGFDPLYVANEGKVIIFIASEMASQAISVLHSHPSGANARVIGTVIAEPKKVFLNTRAGGRRIVDWPEGEQLPRIC